MSPPRTGTLDALVQGGQHRDKRRSSLPPQAGGPSGCASGVARGGGVTQGSGAHAGFGGKRCVLGDSHGVGTRRGALRSGRGVPGTLERDTLRPSVQRPARRTPSGSGPSVWPRGISPCSDVAVPRHAGHLPDSELTVGLKGSSRPGTASRQPGWRWTKTLSPGTSSGAGSLTVPVTERSGDGSDIGAQRFGLAHGEAVT